MKRFVYLIFFRFICGNGSYDSKPAYVPLNKYTESTTQNNINILKPRCYKVAPQNKYINGYKRYDNSKTQNKNYNNYDKNLYPRESTYIGVSDVSNNGLSNAQTPKDSYNSSSKRKQNVNPGPKYRGYNGYGGYNQYNPDSDGSSWYDHSKYNLKLGNDCYSNVFQCAGINSRYYYGCQNHVIRLFTCGDSSICQTNYNGFSHCLKQNYYV
ncbi:hypothetical protein BB561_000991 [Smittium simulii]|uniref:Uncharacterized protein n=1 Tax=Smittium simulii TaxID=133385 RepID=A0A2T9YWM9_9FUNG|nr:hypothetical protein BB561_000991 [Smittium simulii]